MSELVRFGVSIEKDLLGKFDEYIQDRNYSNRSEAFRDLIRSRLVTEEWISGGSVAGAITIVYDHHGRELVNKLMDIQHDNHSLIVSIQHIHLDHRNCLEIIAVKGNANKIKNLSYRLHSVKGVKHGQLTMTTTGKNLG